MVFCSRRKEKTLQRQKSKWINHTCQKSRQKSYRQGQPHWPVSAGECSSLQLSGCPCPAVRVKVAGSWPRGTGAPVCREHAHRPSVLKAWLRELEAGDGRLCSFSVLPMLVLMPENLCCPDPLGPQSCSSSVGYLHAPGLFLTGAFPAL